MRDRSKNPTEKELAVRRRPPTAKQVAARVKPGEVRNPYGSKGCGGHFQRKTRLRKARQGDQLSRLQIEVGLLVPKVENLEAVVKQQAQVIADLLAVLAGETK